MKAPALAVILALAAALPVAAQQTDVELAKKLANPIGSLISVPFQHNYDHNLGLDDRGQRLTVNAQPVVPISVAPDWDIISRTILPITWQEGVVPGEGTQFGLGDTVQSLFLSPKETGDHGIIWGAGPVALLPTATEDTLGLGEARPRPDRGRADPVGAVDRRGARQPHLVGRGGGRPARREFELRPAARLLHDEGGHDGLPDLGDHL